MENGAVSASRAVRAIVERDDEIVLLVDESIYDRGATLRACYWFTDRCHLFVSRAEPGHLAISIRAKASDVRLTALAGEFANALLDHQVRRDIERETRTVRELIVPKAFAEGNFLEDAPVGDDRDPVEIARGGHSPETASRGTRQ